MNISRDLAQYVPLIDCFAEVFGERFFEFVIHDFRTPENSLVYIRGNITNRSIGAPLTKELLKVYKKEGDNAQDLISLITNIGTKKIKSSSIFIRNDANKIIGSLGINIDISNLFNASEFLRDIGSVSLNQSSDKDIIFAKDVNEILNDILDEEFSSYIGLLTEMSREERLEYITKLDERGIFLIKGSVKEIASRLGVSIYTIYNYLEEIRS